MSPYLLTFAIAVLLALAITPLLRLRAGGGRQRSQSEHRTRPVEKPRVGGLIIFLAFALTPFLAALLSPTVAGVVLPKWPAIAGLLSAAFLISMLGYVDDVREIGWMEKCGGQVAAGVILYALGYRLGDVSLPGGASVNLGPFDLPATVLWLWLVTNAVNLIDGHDGVAAGVTALTAGAMALVAWDLDHILVAILFASLAGAVMGFLPFNFPAASRFLGDSGAMLLGFLLGALAISGFVDETGRIPLYIPMVALGVPLLDIVLAFSRRLLNRRNPFHADLDHVHHRIERMLGYGPRRLALSLYAFSALFAVASLGLYRLRGTGWVGAIVAAVAALVALFVWRLGYHETVIQSLTVRRLRGTLHESSLTVTDSDPPNSVPERLSNGRSDSAVDSTGATRAGPSSSPGGPGC